ncbi:ferredoxin [Microbacterium sp. KRD172]|uniref:ferredoxin n=1 Tax=Microbacterium sp. KRD172 TaxID=2729727 RepID=UPI0019D12C0D|nr:ferredoxin [Microbacterium sp. KRD172]
MKLVAHRHLCQSYGNCLAVDPEHVDLDDEGLVFLLRDTVEEGELAKVQAGIRSCPVNALELVEADA